MFKDARYIISAVSKNQFPNTNNYPEFVFLGRSNVGKSSTINAILNRKNLAQTSSKPGKTICLNFYLVDNMYYFVDVPGYGYAARSNQMKEKFGKYIEEYLKNNPNLKIAFLLIDTKVGPTEDDILMYEYLKYLGINIKIIATKSDKVGSSKIFSHKKVIKEKLNITDEDIFVTSAAEKKGFSEIINFIKQY